MSRLAELFCGLLMLAGLLVVGWISLQHYGAEQRRAGYQAAVADGKAQRERDAATSRKTESGLRAQLRARDADAHRKEQEHATRLEAAQRRVRAGDDRLRCPAGPVSASTAPGDRPAAGGSAPDGEGPVLVPEAAADLLGLAADVGGLVRRYDRLVERFEACRAVNAK